MKYFFLTVVASLYIHHGKAYKAAVVAYDPLVDENDAEWTIRQNLDNYKYQIETLKGQGVDIIVFPEYGLANAFSPPKEFSVELTNDTYVIKKLRALSIENHMYVVVNLFEKVKDTSKTTNYYNTNLVFDRTGNIIAKYRKMNLFQEPDLTPGNEVVTFETDFGVKFGIFTCYDILFYTPSRSVLEDGTVTDIIFPTAWTSSMPFFTSLSVQHGYVASNGVNLLVASYNNPGTGLGGGGIYLANGKIAELCLGYFCSLKSLVENVPEIDGRQEPTVCSSSFAPHRLSALNKTDNIEMYEEWKMFSDSDYTFQDVDLSKKIISTTVCHKKFCCNFNITIAQPANTNEYYKLIVYQGKIDDTKDVKLLAQARICSLVACASDSRDSCGVAVDGTTNFRKIRVDSVFDIDKTTFYVPITLNSHLAPIEDTTYCESSSINQVHVQLSTTWSQKGVVSFGIVGITNTASSVTSLKFFVLLVLGKFIVC